MMQRRVDLISDIYLINKNIYIYIRKAAMNDDEVGDGLFGQRCSVLALSGPLQDISQDLPWGRGGHGGAQ